MWTRYSPECSEKRSVPGLRFLYLDDPIGRYAFQLLHLARRPADFDQIHERVGAQSEMHRAGTGGSVTTRRRDVVELCLVRGRSEERRVGKECRSRWSPSYQKKLSV